MSLFQNENVYKWAKIGALVLLFAVVVLFLVKYVRGSTSHESFANNEPSELNGAPSNPEASGYMASGGNVSMQNPVQTAEADMSNPYVTSSNEINPVVSSFPEPAVQPMGQNEVFRTLDSGLSGPSGYGKNKLPKDCFPKDQLTPSELLPGDANSTWAQVNPVGQGDLISKNFLEAGYHIGVNTVGQSNRNPNLQIRSEPPNPQLRVSPWMQSTMSPDLSRKPLEIGN